MRTLRLTRDHLRRFAEASGDLNPLHRDEAFARATPYGRCIAHGALVTIAALAAADERPLRRLRGIHLAFKQPVFPEVEYTVRVVRADAERTRIEVAWAGRPAVDVTLYTADAGGELSSAFPSTPPAGEREPRRWTLHELVEAPPSFDEPYGCDGSALAQLAAELGAMGVPPTVLVWLAAASYTVGMICPGVDALFAGGRITATAPGERADMVSGSVTAVDDRTGLVVLDATVAQGSAAAHMTLQAFLRTPVPPPLRPTVAEYLPPSDDLADQQVLVVGASRGLGAAVTAALATQGAHVWAGFDRSRARADGLREEFGDDHVEPLQFDAQDPVETRRALERVRAVGQLDALVLCAAPPLQDSPLHPATVEPHLAYVRSSLGMLLVPLAEAGDLLAPGGRLVVVSSTALEDPPEGWLHYTAAKGAAEAIAAYCARHLGTRVLVVRPPRLWTDSTNTPLGRLGAAPPAGVAAAIVRWLAADGPEEGAVELMSADDLVAPPVDV